MNYNEVVDEIYQSYLRVKPLIAAGLDRDVRRPETVLGLAAELEVLPPRSRVITVTGSKGKGTASRTLAAILRVETSKKVGLLISPHESEHLDRMRINGEPIAEHRFVEIYKRLRPRLIAKQAEFSNSEYLSPSGLFLLVGLIWFREQGVEHFVLECGRGAKWDECGNIPAVGSIVTSILLEHPEYLGPGLDDIAADKLSVGSNPDFVAIDETADSLNRRLGLIGGPIVADSPTQTQYFEPNWIEKSWRLATAAAGAYLKRPSSSFDPIREACISSASFFTGAVEGVPLFVEGAISLETLDQSFARKLIDRYGSNLLVVLSLPDDKPGAALIEYIQSLGVQPKHIVIEGDEYLHYDLIKKSYPDDILFSASRLDGQDFRDTFTDSIHRSKPPAIYAIGTQSFIRLLRIYNQASYKYSKPSTVSFPMCCPKLTVRE